MAVGRRFEIYKKRNDFGTVYPIFTKFGRGHHLDTAQTAEWSKMTFVSKQKMAADEKLKFTKKNCIT